MICLTIMKYSLDENPGIVPLFLYGLQWWVVSLPSVIIMGMVVARLHFTGIGEQTAYMQKLFWLTGMVTVVQVYWGHRLPLVAGPASTLLVGLVASASAGINAMYSSILIGGALLALAAVTGVLSKSRVFFTSRIVAVILVLIALTLSPTILRLVTGGTGGHASANLCFALAMVFALVICNACLPGVWKSLTVLFGIGAGSLCHFLAFGLPAAPAMPANSEGVQLFLSSFELHPGTLLSFLFCFLALTINELGSIESVGHMLRAKGMDARIKRGAGLQGAANMAAGALGVIGPVDCSLSAGLITATGCASRFTLAPAGIGLALCGFFPHLILLFSCIPEAVMGALMLYLMTAQLAGGLTLLTQNGGVTDFAGGVTVGLPLMIGLLISFAPPLALSGFPEFLRPIAGNGFVIGTVSVILLEHVVFRKKAAG